MNEIIFEKEKFIELSDSEAVKEGQRIKQIFQQKKSYFEGLRNQAVLLQNWYQYGLKIKDFTERYALLEKESSSAFNSNNKHTIAALLDSYSEIFDSLQEYLSSIIPNESRSHDVEKVKSEVLFEIKSEIDILASNVSQKIDFGIKNLLDLKSELGLTGNFGEQIATELKSSERQKNVFMLLFVCSLIFIPILVSIVPYWLLNFSLDSTSENVVKASISVSLLFLSYFFFTQYKLYQMISLRYTHLTGFLGGGATFISQLIESENEDLKVEVNRKLAELFMGLDDILGLIKRNRHPSEISLDKIRKLLNEVMKK